MGTLARLEVKTLKLDQIRFGQVMATLLLPFLSWTDFREEFMHFPWWFWQGGCVWEAVAANIQRVRCRLHQLSCLAAPRATAPRCFGCKGCRLQPGVYLQNPPLPQTAGCHSPYSPPHPDQDCMRALTHGECDQLKLCWARIPGVGGGWQRHDRNGFRGR